MKKFHSRIYISGAILVLTILSRLAFAAGFEGKIVSRNITIPLQLLLQETRVEAAGTMNSEKLASQLFSKTPEMLLKAAHGEASVHLMNIYVKGNKFRTDTEEKGEKISMIYDADTGEMITLVWSSKTAMVTSVKEVNNQMNDMQKKMKEAMGQYAEMMENYQSQMENAPSQQAAPFNMKPTGKTKIIHDYKCELFKGTNSDGNYTYLWLTRDDAALFNSFIKVFSAMEKIGDKKKSISKEESFYRENRGFQVLSESISRDEVEIDELLEVTRQNVPNNLLVIPPGFERQNMQEMMNRHMKQLEQFQKQK